MNIYTSKMKRKGALIVVLFLSCSSIFGQPKGVVEAYNQFLFGIVTAEIAAMIATQEAIITSNNNNTGYMDEVLDLSYGANNYDSHASTGAFQLSTVLNDGVNIAIGLALSNSNVRYYPGNKSAYFEAKNGIGDAAFNAFGQLFLDPIKTTQSNRQEFYQLRREILTYSGKETHKSRDLLFYTATYLILSEGPDLFEELRDFDLNY